MAVSLASAMRLTPCRGRPSGLAGLKSSIKADLPASCSGLLLGPVRHDKVTCGVPQGSVLLWDIGYDAVLGVELPPRCSVVCYADDILVLAAGSCEREAAQRATEAVARVSRHIATLGLE